MRPARVGHKPRLRIDARLRPRFRGRTQTNCLRIRPVCRFCSWRSGEVGGFFAGMIFVSMSGENWACVG
jgi:hypothetical protein